MFCWCILSLLFAPAAAQVAAQQQNPTAPSVVPTIVDKAAPATVSLLATPAAPAAPAKPQFLAAAYGMGAVKNVPLTMAFNDDMMAYYYMWISGFNIASKVSSAGGFSAKSADLERVQQAHENFQEKAMRTFEKPFKAFTQRLEESIATQDTDNDQEQESDEAAFLEKGGDVKMPNLKPMVAKSTSTVFIKWMDLCANYHITSNAYLMLASDSKSLKSPNGYFKLGRTLALLNWQYNLIFNDYMAIQNEYKKVDWLPKHTKYTLRSMDLFVTMNWAANAMDIYVATTTPMTTSKKALSFAAAVNGCENMRSLKNIVMNGYISEYAKPGVAEIFDINNFVLMDFAIKVVMGSAVTRASELYAK